MTEVKQVSFADESVSGGQRRIWLTRILIVGVMAGLAAGSVMLRVYGMI